MPRYTENGITVQFASNYFQFAECEYYKKINWAGVKEMDFGWFDITNNTLWLIELKGYINPNPQNTRFKETDISQPNIIKQKINELLLKSIHVPTPLKLSLLITIYIYGFKEFENYSGRHSLCSTESRR